MGSAAGIYLLKVNNGNTRVMDLFKVNDKDTRTTLITSDISIIDLKQVSSGYLPI